VIVVFNCDNRRPMDWLLCRKEEPVQVQDDTLPAGHGDVIRAVAFDLHHSLFASVGDDKLVKLWDATAWTCIKTVYGCPPPLSLALSSTVVFVMVLFVQRGIQLN
jgi:WD40 repeat protein